MIKTVTFVTLFAAIVIFSTAMTRATPVDGDNSQVTANTTKACCKREKVGQCKGECPLGAVGKSEVTEGTTETQCKFCSKDECKTQCPDCANAEDAKPEVADQTVAKKRGKGQHMGRGMMMGRGMGRGHSHGADSQHAEDHEDFFFLIENRDTIRRTVKNLPNGIETLTESDDEDVAAIIQKHVEAMYDRIETNNPIRMRDPLFRELFANAHKIEMEVEHTEHGVLVKEFSKDDYVVKLLQEHAVVVTKFIKNGYSELPKNHAAPKK